MADNLAVKSDAATTLGTLATDEVVIAAQTVHVCRNKLGFGGDGVYTEVAPGVGLPVAPSAALPAGANVIGGVTQSGNWLIQGNVAHDAADSGNPLKVGARAVAAEIAAVAPGDRVDLLTDLVGKLITRPHCVPESQVDGVASKTDTTDAAVIAAQGLGVRIYVSDIALANSSASNVIVELKSGATLRFRFPVPAGGGAMKHFDPPLRLAANEALNMASLTAATTVYFSASGFKGV